MKGRNGGYIMNWGNIDAFAKQWVKEAGIKIRASFEMKLDIQTKSNPNDLVTNIDREVEQFFIGKIRETFPDHKILGEEGFGDDLKSMEGIVWMLDPIDGTMNFVHQQHDFAISVGIFEDGVGKIGGDGSIWYHDGRETGSVCHPGGSLSSITDQGMRKCRRRNLVLTVYAQV